jgi:hypothetical protein
MHSIVRRNCVYYFRQRIPGDVLKHFGAREIIRSLHTSSYNQAKSLAKPMLGELERVFMTIRAGVLTDEEIEKLVDRYKQKQLAKSDALMDTLLTVDGGSLKSARKSLLEYHKEQAEVAKDVLLDQRGLEELTVHTAQSLLGISGAAVTRQTPVSFPLVARFVARVNSEGSKRHKKHILHNKSPAGDFLLPMSLSFPRYPFLRGSAKYR